MRRSCGLGLIAALVACGFEGSSTPEAYDPEMETASSTGGDGSSEESGMPDASSGDAMDATTTGADETSSTSVDESGDSSTGGEGDCPRVRITVEAEASLNVRPDPSTANPPIGSLTSGTVVEVLDETIGESIDGNDLWYEIDSGSLVGFIFSGFAECTTDEAPVLEDNGWYLPLPCDVSAPLTQGNNGALSHNGISAFAFDLGIPLDSTVVAMADGIVAYTFDETGPGDPCYGGGGSECGPFANYVVLRHADGTLTTHKHLNAVSVAVGDFVPRGAEIGRSGSTGWSTGPHVHFMRMEDCGAYQCQSIPMSFHDVPGDGVPVTGDQVTSGNCPRKM